MTKRRVRFAVGGIAALAGALVLVVAVNSTRWIDTTFPGFFVMANRVIASATLPGWLDVESSEVFQHQVLAVDGVPVESSAAVYRHVGALPPGTPIKYELRAPQGTVSTVVVASRRFSRTDYALLFGAFLLTGVAFLVTALLVYLLEPAKPPTQALLIAGLATGVFAVTGVDLYGPHWFFRLHVLAESLMGAGFVHVALVFPSDRIHGHRRSVLAAVYLPLVLLAVWYEAFLYSPSAYTAAHLAASGMQGLAAGTMILAVSYDFLATRSALVRRRTGIVVLGSIAGFLVPGVAMFGSAMLGGGIPVNAAAVTAFLFPLSLGYAVVKQDLFEIDVMLRRGITYLVVVVTIAGLYFLAIYSVGVVLADQQLARSPAGLAVLDLGLVLLVAPVRARVQDVADRVFFRKGFDPEQALSQLSYALASARTVEHVLGHMRSVFAETLCPVSVGLLLHDADGRFHHEGAAEGVGVTLPPEIVARALRGDVLARYEWDDGSGRPVPPVWQQLEAEILVPVRTGTALSALIVVGTKRSGRTYTLHDIAFLGTVAAQVALALKNAAAFEDLDRAYRQLERNQESLMRADRLATLGRLTAGLAHEVNTPLAAVLNSLKLLSDLGNEYAESIGNPTVEPEDHHQIAQEIIRASEDAARWARKAAGFINKIKMHGREPKPGAGEWFTIRAVVTETEALLIHRLKATGCEVTFSEEPLDVGLVGDASQLGQVLANLVGNAIDAYEEAGTVAGKVVVSARQQGGTLTLTVRDQAGGIPPHVLPRIFDELFTTKEAGRGTGLGLCICRNLVMESFRGTLTVDTTPGVGTCFTATIPIGDQARATTLETRAAS